MSNNIVKGNFGSTLVKQVDIERANKILSLILEDGSQQDSSLHSSDAYSMEQVVTTVIPLRTTPDLATGGVRNKRWGATFSIAILPGLSEVPKGPLTLPNNPIAFYAADSLEDLKARLVYEIDKAIEISKLSYEDPETFKHVQAEFIKHYNKDSDQRSK